MASGGSSSRRKQVGVRLEIAPGRVRIGLQDAIDDRLFQRRLDAFDPGPGWTPGAGHQILAAER